MSTTTTYPWPAIVQIEVQYASGVVSQGSGVVIGSNDILTAAHVVNDAAQGAVVDIRVHPGRDGGNIPYGDVTALGWTTNYYVINAIGGLLSYADVPYDLAVIGASQPVGSVTGTFGIKYDTNDSTVLGSILNVAGYPGDLGGIYMYSESGYPTAVSAGVIEHALDIHPGNSGGPLWWFENGARYVAGVVSTTNYAARLTEATFNQILKWIEGNGHGANNDNNSLFGTGLRSVIDGRGGNDVISGNGGNDILRGGSGDDRIYGGADNDLIVGGLGRDLLYGEAGRDRFDFNSKLEITGANGRHDVIYGFRHLQDKIDLATIDARVGGGNNAFVFIGTSSFTKAGELHYKKFDKPGSSKDITMISADLNGDHKADFQLELKGLVTLTKVDFIL
ncbi:MAG: trypsin-like peptidase domain-containing protein [Hyphomicrobium sp.]